MISHMVVTWPDPRLRLKSSPIETIGREELDLYSILCEEMVREDGVGMSAIQVGVPKRMFIVSGPIMGMDAPVAFINPALLSKSIDLVDQLEGCLSLPGVSASVRRSSECLIETTDISGQRYNMRATGLLARCILHELDHLNGRLMIDVASERSLLNGR